MLKKPNSSQFKERVEDLDKEPQKDKSLESTTADSQEDYRTIFEKSRVGLYVIQRGRFSYVNPCLSNILGYENPDELIGKSFRELIHPDDRRLIKLGMQGEATQVFPSQHNFRVFKKDGVIIWVRMEGSAAIYRGKPANVGHLMDLTPFKEMEKALQESLEKYQTILNEIEDSVGEVDLKGNIMFTNKAGCRIWGASYEESIGRNYRSYVDEETAKIVYEAYNKVFRIGIPGKNIIYEIIRKDDGSRRVIEDSVSLIRNTDGKITGFRTVSRDITDRKEAEKELAEHRTRLEAIFRSVKDAIITVDSELKVIEANKSTENICGIALKEIAGKIFVKCLNQCSKSCCEVLRQTLEDPKLLLRNIGLNAAINSAINR